MKSNYKKLKRTILIRTGLVALLALVIGEGIVHFFIDGIFQGLFTRAMMAIFTGMHMDSEMANEWYGRIFMDHKTVFLVIGFIILFLIFYNLLVKRMLHYLSSVEAAIDAIQREDDEQIVLVPELKPLEDKLMALRATLKRKEMETAISEQKKNDLVVYLAHDLKTPLTSIIAYLTMLDQRKSMPDEDREKYIHVTFEKASRLRELINEFFEITRFNLQDIVLEKEQLNLSFLLEQLADESYGVLKDKYLTCSVKTNDDLMVMGDPDKLARVFDNLLRNAIAYSYTDTEIEIEARAKGTDIVITFENQGHEIPEQNLKLIFEKFYRVDNARSSQTGGSGLGLSIAKRIVELHGGIIEATSDWERTTFTVVLPGIHNPSQKVEIQEKEEEDPLSRHQKLGTNKKSEIGKKNRRRV